ncbi:MAG TPA: lipid-A-disaccharide synthase [Pseudomonadales bacterium]
MSWSAGAADTDPAAPRGDICLGILAGEASGDSLGAGLMAALKRRYPRARFVGIGGPRMLAQDLDPVAPMERLQVNGLVDPVKRLPDLVRLLRQLVRCYEASRPAVFIGVDFNVFNFLLERMLKARGIPTVHYVSPSVYAWRRGRVGRIARSADLLLTLFPFEPALYDDAGLEAVFVGHPRADAIDIDAGGPEGRARARRELQIPPDRFCMAVLPGSRLSEVRLMGAPFLDAAGIVARRLPGTLVIVPCLRPEIRTLLEALLAARPELDAVLYDGDAELALTASDGALVKSGTSTLEAMLLRRPMVVSYKLGPLTYRLIRLLVRTPHIALPNILAGEELVPEVLQDEATPEALAEKFLDQLDKARRDPEHLARFSDLHRQLRMNADERAADAVSRLLDGRAAHTEA